MDYRDRVQEELQEIEKKFNLKIENLGWVESLLSDVYEKGKNTRDLMDYENGYEEVYRVGRLEGKESWENDD